MEHSKSRTVFGIANNVSVKDLQLAVFSAEITALIVKIYSLKREMSK